MVYKGRRDGDMISESTRLTMCSYITSSVNILTSCGRKLEIELTRLTRSFSPDVVIKSAIEQFGSRQVMKEMNSNNNKSLLLIIIYLK